MHLFHHEYSKNWKQAIFNSYWYEFVANNVFFFYELYNEINFNRADIIHHKYCHIMMDYIAFFLIA